jgi:hypothetical protein
MVLWYLSPRNEVLEDFNKFNLQNVCGCPKNLPNPPQINLLTSYIYLKNVFGWLKWYLAKMAFGVEILSRLELRNNEC